jgi:hypothetical protein
MRLIVAGLLLLGIWTASAWADAPKVLFVRGADRSGGFLEAGNDAGRTEQLGDINNRSTGRGNHGWYQLAQRLRSSGFEVSQVSETVESGNTSGQSQGVAVPLERMDLSQYKVIVFGSNNASYDKPAVDAVETYLRNGGGAIFISDANFGGNWADASNSDQPFLDRLGLVANQDNGTYGRFRADNHFVDPNHPIFAGVNGFDGEGVTPVTVLPADQRPAGVDIQILARAKGNVRRNNGTSGKLQGSTSAATANDAALAVGTIGQGRFAWHFDRNTFFNDNGAGTWLTRASDGGKPLDNDVYAVNLFKWTAQVP